MAREPPLDVLILEGWSIGFQPLEPREIERILGEANAKTGIGASLAVDDNGHAAGTQRYPTTTLANHRLEDLLFVNVRLRGYCEGFMGPRHLDLLIYFDADELGTVYEWRMEQEGELRQRAGQGEGSGGMGDEEVVRFGESLPLSFVRWKSQASLYQLSDFSAR